MSFSRERKDFVSVLSSGLSHVPGAPQAVVTYTVSDGAVEERGGNRNPE